LVLWIVVTWQKFVYANTSMNNGRLSTTASIPIYPFIFILGFNVFCLCLVLAFKLVCSIKGTETECCTPASPGEEPEVLMEENK